MTFRETVHVAIILDRSGSMDVCRDATISGFNEYISGIRRTAEEGEIDTRVTLVTFNDEVQTHYIDAPLGRLRSIDRESYVPNGNTAMLDAVGETVHRLEEIAGGRFLVCVISDGEENSSRRYSYSDIAETIQRLTRDGRWTFTYLGSNQDLSRVSDRLHIPRGNMAAYAATPAGTARAWSAQQAATQAYMSSPAAPPANFYGVNDED